MDGDDFTEPVADAVRSILDGHIVLSHAIPKPLSRGGCFAEHQPPHAPHRGGRTPRGGGELPLLSTYEEMEDLINIGAYAAFPGKVDRAARKRPEIIKFLNQEPDQHHTGEDTLALLQQVAAG